MFIVLVQYMQPLATIEAHLAEHRAFLDRHYAAGHFLASGPQVPRTGGAILARNLTRTELEAVLTEDPFHREQIATYQIVEFSPNKFAEGAEQLLSSAR
jgi:uncharacterized protein YciI